MNKNIFEIVVEVLKTNSKYILLLADLFHIPLLFSMIYVLLSHYWKMFWVNWNSELAIINWVKYSGINPLNCACSVTAKKTGSKREEIKELIKSLEKSFKNVKQSIFKSSYNVNLDRVISYEKNGKKFSFLDDY